MNGTKKYKRLIFDADHTLLDYIADEYAAFARVYEKIGMPISDGLLKDSRRFSEDTWTEAGLYDVDEPRVQATYHAVYRSHVTGIFEKVFAKYPCAGADAQRAGELFLKALEREGTLLPHAEQVLLRLSQRYAVCVATNGLRDIQRGRLARFERYAKLYISEEIGFIKPLPAFFEKILREEGVEKEACLMIGDSLRSDMAGAKAAGMDGCWFNPRGEKNERGIPVDYEISSLDELFEFL